MGRQEPLLTIDPHPTLPLAEGGTTVPHGLPPPQRGRNEEGVNGKSGRKKIVLRDDINNALKEAMKAKNERAVSTLRMVNSTLKNADIEARTTGKPVGDAEVLSILQKMIKQRQESVDLYQKGGRDDLVKQEQEEIAIISTYLPKQMSDDEMKAAIEAAVAETGAAGMKDMGKVIGILRGKYAGQMDMAKASGLVKARLQ